MFATKIEEILAQVEKLNPINYGKTRNFLDGAVTRLSPYISRGVITTKYVLETTLKRGYPLRQIEKFVQELAWRDYFQNIWLTNNLEIDIKQPQPDVENMQIPTAIITATTRIEAIDKGINALYKTGYVHNHLRMYIASVTCNVGKSHWKIPAQWFYYHLLDADWASNACSWQWTAAAFSNKKYYANQENINKYCGTKQSDTFLDIDYREFPELEIPEILQQTELPLLRTELPKNEPIEIDNSLPTLIYNFYNLDPIWKPDVKANRVLLLEPSHFKKYPVSIKTIEFILKLSENIERIQIYVGEFGELQSEYNLSDLYFKEHPTNLHYKGSRDERDWMFPDVNGHFQSFFAYWKRCVNGLT